MTDVFSWWKNKCRVQMMKSRVPNNKTELMKSREPNNKTEMMKSKAAKQHPSD